LQRLTPRVLLSVAAMLTSLLLVTSPAGATAWATLAPVPVANGVAVNTVTHTVYGLENGTTSTTGALAVFASTNLTSAVKTIPVGYNPFALAVNSRTNTVYVLNYGPTASASTSVTVISGATNTVTTTISGLPAAASAIAVNPTTNRIYVTGGAGSTAAAPGSLSVINGATNTVSILGVGYNPEGVAVNTATNQVYVTNAGSSTGGPSLTVINGRTNAVVTNPTTPSSAAPAGLAVDSSANRVYVASSLGLLVFNGATNAFGTTVTVGASLSSVAVDHVAGLVFVNSSTLKNVYAVHLDNLTLGTSLVGPAQASAHATALAVDPTLRRVFDANATYGTVSVYSELQYLSPQAPGSPTLAAGVQSLTVSWSSPKDLGPAVSYYDVLVSTSAAGPFAMSTSSTGSCSTNVIVPTTSCTVTGLTTGTTYYVEVKAANAAGFSPLSKVASATAN